MSDIEKALEVTIENESDAENTVDSHKKKADNANTEMQQRAMERIRSTQKRNGGVVEDEEYAQQKPNIIKRIGGETVALFTGK